MTVILWRSPQLMHLLLLPATKRFSMWLRVFHVPTVTWLKGIRDVVESGRSCVEMDGDSYRFVLKKANYGDGGTYIVKASNCHGSQKAYCTVRVSYRVDHERLISRPQACHPLLYILLGFCNRSRKRPTLPTGISRTRRPCSPPPIWPSVESDDSTKVQIKIKDRFVTPVGGEQL